jgi:CcmD family protein
MMGYLVAAYSLIWGLIFIYTVVLGNRQKKLLREVEMLRQALEDK